MHLPLLQSDNHRSSAQCTGTRHKAVCRLTVSLFAGEVWPLVLGISAVRATSPCASGPSHVCAASPERAQLHEHQCHRQATKQWLATMRARLRERSKAAPLRWALRLSSCVRILRARVFLLRSAADCTTIATDCHDTATAHRTRGATTHAHTHRLAAFFLVVCLSPPLGCQSGATLADALLHLFTMRAREQHGTP